MIAPNPFLAFLDRYENDWVLLVEEVLGANPDEMQQKVLRAVCRGERRISIRSGHRVGKTTVLAWCIICHFLTRFPQKTVATAPTKGQLFDALASETKAWMNKLPQAVLNLIEVKVERIELKSAPNESFIAFNTSRAETPEAMAGVHSDNVLLIGDEASGIPEGVYEAAIGSMAGHRATTLLAGNPVRSTGLFYDTHNKPAVMAEWKLFHISCINHPRITPDFIKQVATQYGIDSNAYRVRVLGEFPKGDDDTVIPRELVMSALTREVATTQVTPVWGVSVARFGNNSTALARRRGNALQQPVATVQGYDVAQIVGWVKQQWDATVPSERPTDINVDILGLGAQVVDRLHALDLPARGVNVAERPAVFDQLYGTLRTELYFTARRWFEAMDCAFAGDTEAADDLCMLRFRYAPSGKMLVETQEDIRDKRKLPVPARAEAFILTLATDAITASGDTTRGWQTALKRDVGVI